ncbi:TniA-like transposition protein (plasmid) [Cupriavidus necator N-1]|uniref:TniA-like transposition protein n=1 Tax=Cupriavidus necator (strain ATCC 43291 / DSM 13513 / CCUG 52238 / LMG 8453 / N-1) TaxID=1042878 RepID=F8GXG3_CUPNN|nr:TniA-like transposition protein [Cupriavidus necator N-1]
MTQPTEREFAIARVLRPLGRGPLSRKQADYAGKLLRMHRSTVYRLRQRFLADPVASALSPYDRGPRSGKGRLPAQVENIVNDVLSTWLPQQRYLAHPLFELTIEIRKRCAAAGVTAPARSTVSRRWAAYRKEEALLQAALPAAAIPPGSLVARYPMDIVQVDHTLADVIVVDELYRRPIGRPWLSLAVDVATRCVVGVYVGMDRPNAATVALLLTRVVLPKLSWLASLEVSADWPMHGIPKVLHLDNAAEFKSRALRSGCSQYGVELMYRPAGRPYFGGHIERLNRTLMERVHSLPGSTGSSPKGRKARPPEREASLTIREFEKWLVLEIAQRYHHNAHRGLRGATPYSMWATLGGETPPKLLPDTASEALRFLIQFLPMTHRTVQADGLTLFYIRYWHPIFTAWRATKQKVITRFHPEDLSKIFVSVDGKRYLEATFADLRRDRVSLWEQRSALRHLRAQGQEYVSEAMLFMAIDEQRRIVARARTQSLGASRRRNALKDPVPRNARQENSQVRQGESASVRPTEASVDYSKPAIAYDVEQW